MPKILMYPDPILRQKALPVTDFGPSLQQLITDLKQAALHPAAPNTQSVGLAANQIGVLKRVFLITMPASPGQGGPNKSIQPLINPQIIKSSKKFLSALPQANQFLEGCLSFPGYYAFIDRPLKISVRWQDPTGLAHTAILTPPFSSYFQHERDHLDGILFIDYVKKSNEQMYQHHHVSGRLRPVKNPF